MDQHGLTRADMRDSRNAEPGERGPGSKKALSMAMVRRLRAAFSRVDLLIPPLKQARRTPKRAATGYWNNTAIFITWDDWGGWYDHEPPTILAPPQGDYQYGFRVPLLAVSACTPSGYINNGRHDFGSILRFIEHNFRIPEGALNFADARAKDNLTGFFNLSAAPRAFHKISAAKDAAFFLTDQRPATNPDDD